MIMSRFLTRKANETLQAYYESHGACPTEPSEIVDEHKYLRTMAKLTALESIAMAVGVVAADDDTP